MLLGFKGPGPSGIYGIRRLKDGRVYIGSSKDVHRRLNAHFRGLGKGRHGNQYLQRAWNTDGGSGFCFEIIEICEQKDLICREQFWIDLEPLIFNVAKSATPGPNHPRSFDWTEERRSFQSEMMKGNSHLLGKTMSPLTKLRLSKSRKGKSPKRGPEWRKKVSERMMTLNKATNALRPQNQKGKKLSEEHRAKLRGRKLSPEHWAKLQLAIIASNKRRRKDASSQRT